MRSLVLAVLFAACAAVPTIDRATVLRHSAECVVCVRAVGGHGSGTVVDCRSRFDGSYDVSVLTAKHVADLGGLVVLGSSATVTSTHPALDAAVIHVVLPFPVRVARMRPTEVVVGEDLFTVGFGGGSYDRWISAGFASDVRRGGSVCPGDSGGGVFDAAGMFVGVITMVDSVGISLVMHHGHFQPVTELREWLDGFMPRPHR